MREITVLRLDHRSFRDQRITTHVALTSRAFGTASFYYSGEEDQSMESSVRDVIKRWGGNMKINYLSSVKSFISKFEGIKIHLTMYGESHIDTLNDIKKFPESSVLVIVGGAKVPRYIYDIVDLNTSIGWQPHSEVAAIGILLYEIKGPDPLYKKYVNASIDINENNTKRRRSEKFQNIA